MADATAVRPYHYRACRCPRCGQTLDTLEEQFCQVCQCSVRAAARAAAEVRRQSGKRQASAAGALTLAEAFGILGVPLTASAAEIKTGLHRAVAQWHPDRLEGMAVELRAWAATKTARINAAYEVIRQNAMAVREP